MNRYLHKIFVALFAVMSLSFVSCSSDDEEIPNEDSNYTGTIFYDGKELKAKDAVYRIRENAQNKYGFTATLLDNEGYEREFYVSISEQDLSEGQELNVSWRGINWSSSVVSADLKSGSVKVKAIKGTKITLAFDDFTWTQTSNTSSSQWDITISGEITYMEK